jgi:chemotaxis protein methyltransferase CheR
MNCNLTDIEFSKVSEIIATSMGLHFPDEKRDILNFNLASAAHESGFKNMSGLIKCLLSSELSKDQIKILASHLTISETYFWREPQVFNALKDFILPELIKSKNNNEKTIRILSVGCSTGEEPYSIAIALQQTIQDIHEWNISIQAIDINQKALDKAKTGVYGAWSFRNTPEWIKTKYFNRLDDKRYEIIPETKNMVTYSCLNLTGDDINFEIGNKIDIIFCRNVLMYFTNEWINKISQSLFHCMSEDGWFVVSSCELSFHLFQQFSPVNFTDAILYRKSNSEKSVDNSYLRKSRGQLICNSLFLLAPDKKIVNQFFSKNSDNIVFKDNNHPSTKTSTQLQTGMENKVEFQTQTRTIEYGLSEKIISIRLLANQGYLEEALSLCKTAIESNKLNSALYYLQSSILQEQDKIYEAIMSLKQAIYIDPDNIMGHFTLGNLFIQQGIIKTARRYFNNALELLDSISNDEIIAESDGLSAGYIREIIYSNLQTQQMKPPCTNVHAKRINKCLHKENYEMEVP